MYAIRSYYEKKDTLRVLLVGNSYTYYENLPQVISLLSEGTPCKLITRKSVAGGVTFKQHWLGERALAQPADHRLAPGLDALGDGDLALARQQLV